jgi:TolB-like protein
MERESLRQVTTPAGAVFLSYASQDVDVARRICDALRAAEIEVWFDQTELRGGDVWDQKIRQQIRDCTLFVPIISQHTQERLEGYFRLEWKLAVDRSHLMATERPFLVPVVVDGTRDQEAFVPDAFRAMQWSSLPGGEASPAFAAVIARLLCQTAPDKLAEPSVSSSQNVHTAHANARIGGPEILILALLFFLTGGALWWLSSKHEEKGASAALALTAVKPATMSDKSIAVLPFLDLSEKHDQDYFAEGMAEEIIDLLAQIPALKVIGRTSSFQFKGQNPDLRMVGSALGVSYVLEGSVRTSGDQLRVTAQLISTQDGSHLWSNTYDRPLGDTLKIQDQIATNVVRALQLSVGAAGYPERTAFKSPEAYDLYLRGLHARERYDKAGFESAMTYLQQALDLEPNSVPVLESLAVTQWLKSGLGYEESAHGYEEARLFAQRALELNPKSGTAYSVLASVNFVKWDWSAAERDGEEGLRLEPRNPRVLGSLANVYRARGRWVEGARLLEIAISLDPLNPDWHLVLSWMQYSTGNLRDAETEVRKALEISPTNGAAHRTLGHVLLGEGKLDAALAEMQQGQSNRGLAFVYYAMGRRTESDAALAKLMDNGQPSGVALVYAYRRQLDQAFTWLERAYGVGDAGLVGLKEFQVDPLLKNFAHDPRFAAFLRKMNLPE